jgi:hypothetical protein
MSTTGASPDTVTVSATDPTVKSAFTVTAFEPVSSTPWRFTALKPVNVNVTS